MSAVPQDRLQRSEGEVRIGFAATTGATRLETLFQQGCLKARLPDVYGGHPETVLINTAGGLTDGDHLGVELRWGEGTRAVATSQAAERIYRCRADPAVVRTELAVADGAVACWLPQETILFEGAYLRRQTSIELAGSASLFGVESLVFGRRAMGETLDRCRLFDRLELWRDGERLLVDTLSVDGPDTDAILDRRAVLGGARCVATMFYSGPAGPALVDPLRAVCRSDAVAGVTDLGGVVLIRLIADDSRIMRRLILACYRVCLGSSGFTEPRVWHC